MSQPVVSSASSVSSAAASQRGVPQWRVTVFCYDLSMGMARSLSPQLLGKQIDAIYHTGVVVYGYEYFFGGGIAATRPAETQAGRPMTQIEMGFTSIDQATFHEFLRGISERFTPQTYSLMSHNCNNFSHEVVKFLTGNDMPAYITGLPQEVLSSPAGAMFRPIIAQMEQQFRSSNMLPWSPDLLNLPQERSIPPDRYHVPNADDERAQRQAQASLGQGAHIAGASTTILGVTPAGTEGSRSSHPHASLQLKAITASLTPMLSTESKVSSFYALLKINNKKANEKLALTESERQALEELIPVLSKLDATSSQAPESVPADLETRGARVCERLIREWSAELVFPVLGVYRMLALRPRVAAAIEDDQAIVEKLLSFSQAPMAAQAMALCAVSNLFARPSLGPKLAAHASFVAAQRTALSSSPHQSVRLMAATLAYNSALCLPKDDSDVVIELTSFLTEHLSTNEETDVEVMHRCLLALGSLLYGNSSAALLVASLDFDVSALAKRFSDPRIAALVNDINAILQHEQTAMTA